MNSDISILFAFLVCFSTAMAQNDSAGEINESNEFVTEIANQFDTLSIPITPAIVVAVAVESEVMYAMAIDDEIDSVLTSYNPGTLLAPELYLDDEKGLVFFEFESDIAEKMYQKAEENFQAKNFVEARKYYLKTLEKDPNMFLCELYIGQTYKMEGQREEYEKRINQFLKDHPDHGLGLRLKGLDLAGEGKYEEALSYMIKSSVYNRNNPMNTMSMNYSLKEMGMKYDKWEFEPKIRVDSSSPGSIGFSAAKDWLMPAAMDFFYALDPAVKRRRSYRGDLGKERQMLLVLALLGAEYDDRLENHEDRALAVLHEVHDEDLMVGYFLYEVLLPRYPYYAMGLDNEDFESITQYLKEYRFVDLDD